MADYTAPEYASPSQGAEPKGEAQARFSALTPDREPFLVRARRQSRLTIPSIFREYGENGTTTETLPWQSLCGYGVNVLSAKVTQSLWPVGIPNIKLRPTKEVLLSFSAIQDPDQRGKIKAATDKGLSGVEKEYTDCCAEDGDRVTHYDAARHLVVGGNHCIKMLESDKLQSIPLENYVTVRDPSGTVLEWIIQTPMAFRSLPPDMQEMVVRMGYRVKDNEGKDAVPSLTSLAPISVYTHGCLDNGSGRYTVYQEVYGAKVPGSDHLYKPEDMPYFFLRWVALEGEHYGRSFCEDYEGDMQALDGFWQMLTEGSGSIAAMKWLVKPGGVTNKKAFAEAPNGAVLTGNAEDVAAVRSEKQADLQTVFSIAQQIENRLERAFLIPARRQGERVTAEEIKGDAQELEQSLGGVYANQVTSYQAPVSKVKMAFLMRHKRITQLPKNTVKVTVITGEDALGRMQDQSALDEFIETSGQALQEASPITSYLNIGNYLSRGAANRGIDPDGLIKSDDQVQQEAAQAQQQQLSQQVAPEAVKQLGTMAQNIQQGTAVQGPGAMAQSPTDDTGGGLGGPPAPAPAPEPQPGA